MLFLNDNPLLNQDPYSWAFEVLNEIKLELGIASGAIPQRLVAVYGKSQIGKTTFILYLLGIRYSKELESTLRGGRKDGESSTSTATIYRKSPDNIWRLLFNDEDIFETEDSNEAKDYIAEIRNKIEKGICSEKPVEIAIPNSHFYESVEKVKFILLDIPGIESTTIEEHLHVRKICDKYLPLASLVLLMGRVDDLRGIIPANNKSSDFLRYWHRQIERFRFVTTYSYSSDSFRNFLFNIEDEKKLLPKAQERLWEQMASYSPIQLKEEHKRYFYPFELGRSLEKMEQSPSESKKFFQINQILNDARNMLLEDLNISSAPIHQLHAVFGWPKTVRSIYEQEIDSRKRMLSKIEDNKFKFIESTNKNYASINLNIDHLNSRIQKKQKIIDFGLSAIPDKIPISLLPAEKDTKVLLSDFHETLFNIKKLYNECIDFLNRNNLHTRIDVDFWEAECSSEINKFIKHINSYFFDSYFIDDNWYSDLNYGDRVLIDFSDQIRSQIDFQWHNIVNFHIDEIHKLEREKAINQNIFRAIKSKENRHLTRYNKNIESINNEIKAINLHIDKLGSLVPTFTEKLSIARNIKIDQNIKAINESTSDNVGSLVNLISGLETDFVYKTILHGKDIEREEFL